MRGREKFAQELDDDWRPLAKESSWLLSRLRLFLSLACSCAFLRHVFQHEFGGFWEPILTAPMMMLTIFVLSAFFEALERSRNSSRLCGSLAAVMMLNLAVFEYCVRHLFDGFFAFAAIMLMLFFARPVSEMTLLKTFGLSGRQFPDDEMCDQDAWLMLFAFIVVILLPGRIFADSFYTGLFS